MARSRGEGSIHQRKDGRWQASLQAQGVRKTVYGKSRQEAARRLAKLKRQAMDTGTLPDAGKCTVDDLLDRWLETIEPTLKPRTLDTYRQTARLYLRPTLGSVRLDHLAPERIQRLYTTLQRQGHKRVPTKAHSVLHRALKMAVLWGWLVENPADRVMRPTYAAERKHVWTAFELNVFLTRSVDHWLYPVWMLAIVTGARLGELRALAWNDVDLAARQIDVNKTLARIDGEWLVTRPKTASGDRTIVLPREGMDALESQHAQQDKWRERDDWQETGLVFTQWTGAPLHGATVAHGLKTQCERLGITSLTPHGLRHMHASLLLDQGLPAPVVAARLGHSTPQVTMAVYAHMVDRQDDAAVQAIAAALAVNAE